MSQDNSKPTNFNDDIDGLTNSFISEIKDNIRQVIREKLPQYLQSKNAETVAESSIDTTDNSNLFEAIFDQVLYSTISSIVSGDNLEKNLQSQYHNIIENKIKYSNKTQQSSLFKSQSFEAIAAAALMASSMKCQIEKEDTWKPNEDGIAYSQHKTKDYSQNYIEHYITTPGDITLLPWKEAQQIIDKFGFTSAKLHLIFAAYTMQQEKPWESLFTIDGSDLIEKIGWDKRTDLPKYQKLLEIAKIAFALDCLLVKTVWVEGRSKKGGINASTPIGRMWNITIVPYGQVNISGKIEKPDEIKLVIQPGTWTQYFLNRAGAESREALYQFSYLAQEVLKIDPYHDELALRLAIYLTLDSRFPLDRDCTVQELLEIALLKTTIDKARSDCRRAYDLKQRWDVAITLLLKLGWQITFDYETYPSWLRPNSKEKKPRGYLDKFLNAKLNVKPPALILELTTSKLEAKAKRLKPKTKDKAPQDIKLNSSQVREARIAKDWSQAKLASFLGVSQKLVSMIELGQHPINPQLAEKIQTLLDI
jgi:DNA-binding XRE family transcriptional regulator